MKLSNMLSVGLVALTALSLSASNVSAHNPIKYTGIPFVVAGNCPGETSTINYVSNKGTFGVQITNADSSTGYAGWEVFTSFPGVNPGNTIPSASTSAPLGTYTFTISGLPSGSNFIVTDTVDTSAGENYSSAIPISNGRVSVTPLPPSSLLPVAVVNFSFDNDTSTNPIVNPITVSNFFVNNTPIGFDTTHTDTNPSVSGSFGWCWNSD